MDSGDSSSSKNFYYIKDKSINDENISGIKKSKQKINATISSICFLYRD